MKGDFTRSTFQPNKHYTSVRMQQGRLQLDSDWNEQVDIEAYLRHAQAVDMIGADSGVPTSEGDSEQPYRDSFKISVTPDGSDLAIAPGRLYVNGTLCELETGTHFKAKIKASNRVEVSSLIVDGHPLEQGQWLEYPTQGKEKQSQWLQIQAVTPNQRELTFSNVNLKDVIGAETEENVVGKEIELRRLLTYNTQPDYPKPNDEPTLTEGVYLAYIDVWQRHITALEDSTIREVALNIPDTTTRTKTVWQLKLKKLDKLEEITESDTQKKEWEDFFKKCKIESRQPYLKACAKYCPVSGSSASAETGYRRLENQLYRVEIHDPSPKATFKWSRDNGSIVSAIKNIQGNTIIIRKTSQDAWTSSQTGQWIEITNEEMELKGKPGALAPLLRTSDTKIEFDTSRITNGEILSKATKVRRWEQIKEVAIANQFDQSGWVDLEAGIKVQFDKNSVYETGDYWLIPARSATNDIEWPNDQAKPTPQPLPQLPQGIEHDYCALALVKVNSQGKFEQDKPDQEESKSKNIKDLRVIFPPLMRCLDKAGGVITGTLEIQSDLYVTGRYQKQVDRYVDGKVGIGTKQPFARLHTKAAKPIPVQEQITSNEQQVNLHQGSNFTTEFHEGDLLKVGGQERIITKVEDKSLTINDTLAITEPKSFEYQQPIARLENSDGNPQFVVLANGNTGIGTPTPYNSFDVVGGVAIGQAYAGKTKAPDNGLLVDGTVSIGSTLPSDATNFKLYVNGNIKGNSITAKSGIFRSQEGTNLSFQTGDTTQITVASSSGNVGIGIGPDTNAKLNLGGALKLTNNDQTAAVSLQIDKTDSDNWLQFTATNLTGYSFDQPIAVSLTPNNETDFSSALQLASNTQSVNLGFQNQNFVLRTKNQDRIAIAHDTGHVGITSNVGIGGSNPAQKLVVEDGNVGIGYNDSEQSAMLAVKEKVGIGITKPNAQLHVIGTVQVDAKADTDTLVRFAQNNQSVKINLQNNRLKFSATNLTGYSFDQPIAVSLTPNNETDFSSALQLASNTQSVNLGFQNQNFVLRSNDQDSIAIAPNGKISIGNTGTKNAQLQLNGTFQVEAAQDAIAVSLTPNNETDFSSALQLASNTQSVNLGFQNQNFVLRSNDQDRITITHDGKVGIGTPNSPSQIDINGTAKATRLEGNSLKLKDLTIDQFSNETNLTDNEKSVPTEKAVKTYVDTEINGLKTDLKASNEEITQIKTTLADKAAQKGDLKVDFNAKSLNVETSIYAKQLATETINSNRVLTREAVSNGFYQISSRALKEEINDLSSQEVSAILRTLHPVKFIYTEDEEKTPHAGFIAEDTPDLLTANEKQAIKVVDIVAILTKVAQDHRKTLSDVVKIVKKQQTEIAILTEKVKALEKQSNQ